MEHEEQFIFLIFTIRAVSQVVGQIIDAYFVTSARSMGGALHRQVQIGENNGVMNNQLWEVLSEFFDIDFLQFWKNVLTWIYNRKMRYFLTLFNLILVRELLGE